MDLIEALTYLERKNICFRNISPENVFLFENETKMGNFENAFNSIGESSTKFDRFNGEAKYAEPKISEAFLKGESEVEYNYFKNDVFALGFMILEMISLQNYNKVFGKLKKDPKILEKQINQIEEIYGPEGAELAKLLGLMLRENSKERPNFIELSEIISDMTILKKNDKIITLSVVDEIKESEIQNKLTKNHQDLLQKGFKFEESMILREEKKENSSDDDLNERDSEGCEEIKECQENKPKQQHHHTKHFLLSGPMESDYSSNFFGLDRESNILISELPAAKAKFTPEKLSALQKLKQSILGLHLKNVDLVNLKIEANKPRKINFEGDVFVCSNKSHLNLVAKVIKDLNEENVFAILRRYEYINARNCMNILKLEEYALEVIHESGLFNLFLVFKHKKWDLKYAIQNKNFPAVDKLTIAKQIVKVLLEFNREQKEKIVHGNLKPSNILLDNKNVVFLTDFGTSETFIEGENLKKSRRITINYSPPEQFLYKRLELNSDIWSLGLIFCELFFNVILNGENIVSLGLYDEERKDFLTLQESFIGEVLWKIKVAKLIQKMTFFESFKRISLLEILDELDSIENMLKYPSSLQSTHGDKLYEESGSSFEKKDNSKYFHAQKNSVGFLTKQQSHCSLKNKEKSNCLESRNFATPKTCSRKTKTTKKFF